MNRWPQKRLEEVSDLINGRAFEPSEWSDKGTRIIRIQNLNDSSKPYNYYDGSLPEKYRVRAGDILLSWSGTPGTSFGCFRWKGPEGWLNQHIFNVKLREELHPDFFVYQVNSMLGELIAMAHGGVGLQHVTKGMLGNLMISIPSMPEQERIVKILYQAEQLRRLRTEADRCTEELIPALFYEMFSDQIPNGLRYHRSRLEEVCTSPSGIKAGPFGSSLKKECYTTEGPRVYGQEQVIAGDFTVGDYHISQAKCDEMQAYSVCPGDVLISLVGTFGKIAVVPENVQPGIINPRLIRIRVNQGVILPIFLKHYLELKETQVYLQSLARGQTMGVLNATLLRAVTLPVPPLEQQSIFAACVAEIQSLKAEQMASHLWLNGLFQALLHQAFHGEL